MNTNRKGFTPLGIALVAVIIIVIIGIGAYYFFKPFSNTVVTQPVTTSSSITTTTTPTSTVTVSTPTSTPTSTTSTASHPTSTTASSTGDFIMTPDHGPVGTRVTIYGSGFASTGNTVTINGMVSGSLKNLTSNGGSIVFTVPSSIGPNCKPNEMCAQYLIEVTPRVYTVAIISDGVTQTVGSFTVTD